MAYPGTYNFNYYRGDTFEFKIYPKTSTGSVFDLTTYDPANGGGGAGFTIAKARGASGASQSPITCVATINLSDNSITCRIRPTDGISLDPNRTHVYDVQISKGSGTSATVFTLLTGSISVEDHVTGATA
jgi:hypothetical protein